MAPQFCPDDRVVGAILGIATARLDRTRNGDSYLRLSLSHPTGFIDGRWWQVSAAAVQWVQPGLVVQVDGVVESYANQLQLKIARMEPRPDATWAQVLPRSARPVPEMLDELAAYVAGLRDASIRQCVARVLAEPEVAARLPSAPAAKLYHHARIGGLLEHTLNVVRLCEAAARQYPEVDRDVLIATAILHDLGKVFDYSYETGFDFTNEGKLVGHVVRGAALVQAACQEIPGFPEPLRVRLVHAVTAHHGEKEKGSPVEPGTLEAVILHHLDHLDGDAGGFLDWVRANPESGPWTPRSPQLGRELFRPEG